MARKKIALKAATAPARNSARQQLVARRGGRRPAATIATQAASPVRPAASDLLHHPDTARRDAIESMLLQLVTTPGRVLVIGRETWPLSRSLSSAGCRVSVVETRQDMPAGSATFSDRVIIGDPETLDLAATLDTAQFDSILAVRLLEHVQNPVRMLKTLRRHLTADGAVVAAVPNIMHGRIRLEFASGRSPAELLAPDTTSPPSHWYDGPALQRVFERASFAITRLERQTEAFDASAAPLNGSPLPSQLVDGLMQDADATTRTFVVVAHPLPLTGRVLLDMRVRDLAQAHERVLQQMQKLLDRGAALDARYAELKQAADGAIRKMDRMQPSLTAAYQHLTSERVKLEAIGREVKAFRYEQLILRLRVLVERTLPKGALALVVSKGDERLLAFDGRRAWHFLRNEKGVYAGHHPADSAAAIAALERCRAAGAGYLIVPHVAFWWLDHYAAFREHLARRSRVLVRDDRTAVIYALDKRERRR